MYRKSFFKKYYWHRTLAQVDFDFSGKAKNCLVSKQNQLFGVVGIGMFWFTCYADSIKLKKLKKSCTSQENMLLYPFPTSSIYKLKIKIITT